MDEKGELVKSYSNLSVENKRIELEREIDEISLIIRELVTDLKPDYPRSRYFLLSRFPLDNIPESEYLTYLYENIIDLKETLGEYCDFATSVYYDSKEPIDLDN